MGYVNNGEVCMSVMDLDGSDDIFLTYNKPRDCYFVPVAYLHPIEVFGSENIHLLIFFDQTTPGDIGYRTSTTALSREVLAATFDVSKEKLYLYFLSPATDPLIVIQKNLVDAVVRWVASLSLPMLK